MIMGAWGLGRKRLPYDAEVEYLQSAGYQYIDTGIKGTLDTDIYVDAIATQADNAIPLGVGKDGGSPRIMCFMFWTCSDFFSADGSGGRACYNAEMAYVNSHYEFIANKNTRIVKRNGVVLNQNNNAASQEFTTSKNIWLFNSSSQTVGRGVRLVHVTIRNGATMVRDFIPVRFTNEQGQSEGAMYDRVSGQLFRNQGTGSFAFGPDK